MSTQIDNIAKWAELFTVYRKIQKQSQNQNIQKWSDYLLWDKNKKSTEEIEYEYYK
jgi:hypothetical protein